MSLNRMVMRLLSIILHEIGVRSYEYGYRVFTEPAMAVG